MSEGAVGIAHEGPQGRILVADSLTFFDERAGSRDVVVGASFAGAPTVVLVLARGIKGVIAHAAGVGKDQAGIAGLALAQRFGVPAAAVETMSARLSDGGSLYAGTIGHANETAAELGVRPGQSTPEAARLMLEAAPGRPADVEGLVDERIHELHRDERGAICAVWSMLLVGEPRPQDVFCAGSHAAKVMADYALKAGPRAVIANDAGMALDRSGIDGLPPLEDAGIAAAAVAAMSARIGDALSTYEDGVISAANRIAAARGVTIGMPAKDAALAMLG